MTYMETAVSSASPEWPTPRAFFDALNREFGPFDLDPASNAANAKAPMFYTAEDDGLAQPWKGRVWLNPPYGRTIPAWMAKAAASVADGSAELVCCLVPARVDTRWWRDALAAASLVRIIPGRLKFGFTENNPAPFPSAVIVFGELSGRHGIKPARCGTCREWWFPPRSDGRHCSPKCRQAAYRLRVKPVSRNAKRGSP